ncbi:spore gernimation protein GerXB, partial [Bacillus sp. CRN 9]|nr:spore gernimation protein GerXB [Bacillus sp. CRN 9]
MRFSRLQLSFVLLLFIGISNHVLILPHLLGIAKRDAWICILIGYAILILWAVIFTLIFSKNKERVHLLTWLKLRTGKLI